MTDQERRKAVADLLEAVRVIAESAPGAVEELTAIALASVALGILQPRRRYGRLAS